MIQELKKDVNLAWKEELISIKVKLNKNEQVSFFRICWGFFVRFINKVFFCFPNFNGSETEENIWNEEKWKEAFQKMIENKKNQDKPIVKILCSKIDGKLTWEGIGFVDLNK